MRPLREVKGTISGSMGEGLEESEDGDAEGESKLPLDRGGGEGWSASEKKPS